MPLALSDVDVTECITDKSKLKDVLLKVVAVNNKPNSKKIRDAKEIF